jgi:hypothetical protein
VRGRHGVPGSPTSGGRGAEALRPWRSLVAAGEGDARFCAVRWRGHSRVLVGSDGPTATGPCTARHDSKMLCCPGERLFTAFSGREGFLRSRFFLLGRFKRGPISLLFFFHLVWI